MIRSFVCLLLFSCPFAATTPIQAQPPDISFRWSNNTAFVPPQGYGMGSPLTLSWSIVNDGLTVDGASSNLRSFLNGIYGNQTVWLPHFQSAFDRWSALCGLTFVYQATDSGTWGSFGSAGTRGDIRIGGRPLGGGSSTLAYNYYPDPADGIGGDMIFNTSQSWYSTSGVADNSLGLRNVIAHEHGHGMGMPHVVSNNSAQLLEPVVDLTFDGPQHHDILMAHRGYGDVHEKSFGQLGNDVHTRATPLGLITNGGNVSVGDSARGNSSQPPPEVLPTDVDFVSIDDASDTDYWSFSVNTGGTINATLDPLGFTYNAGPQSGGPQISVNTQRRSDLTLALFDTNGTTLLSQSNSGGLGASEFLSLNLSTAGTYFFRITGLNNSDSWAVKTQFYGLSASFVAVPEPSAIFACTLAACLVLPRRRRGN